jgi:hypothetical protein
MDEAADPRLGAHEVCVRIEIAVVGSAWMPPCGIGAVDRAGDDAQVLLGRRVLVPAITPSSEERDAPLVPNRQPDGHEQAWAWSHLSCSARWVLPLEAGLELPARGAVVGRELANAYALMVAANTLPRAPVIVVGDGACAELVVQVAAARNVNLARLRQPADDPRSELATSERIFVLVADANHELAGAVAELVTGLERPSVAILAGSESMPVDLAELAVNGTTVVGVPGAHPDLLAEVAAMVIKGHVDLEGLVTETSVDGQLGPGLSVVTLA